MLVLFCVNFHQSASLFCDSDFSKPNSDMFFFRSKKKKKHQKKLLVFLLLIALVRGP